MTARAYRQLPLASRQRGLPSIGFEMVAPAEVELTPIAKGAAVVRCSERRADGKRIGELEVSVFKAAMIIDRDGILEEKARDVAQGEAHAAKVGTMAVQLPGASGFRAEAQVRASTLPFVYVFAMASNDLGIDGGVVITVRSAQPDWPAADAILGSLRILSRNGVANTNDEPPLLPIVTRRR